MNPSIPAALEPATRTESRRVKIPATEIDLRLDDLLLDPRRGARASIILDIELDGTVDPAFDYKVRESAEGAATTYLNGAALIYGSKVVSGSASIQAFQDGAEIVEQPRLADALIDENQEALG